MCPPSYVLMTRTSGGPLETSAVIYDSTYLNVYRARVAFNRQAPSMFLSGSSGGRLTAWSRVIERFEIVGDPPLPPGTPVAATLIYRVDGYSLNQCGGSGCGVVLVATMAVGPDSVSADAIQPGPGYSRRDVATTLGIPVVFIAGSPIQAAFTLHYGTGPGGSAEGEITGKYGVSGLPAGVRAIACSGPDVTPIRRSSWGSLKSLYR